MAELDFDFTFEVDGLEEGTLRVLRFEADESLSTLSQYDIEICSLDPEVDFAAVVGKKASLRYNTSEGERHIHGVCARFSQGRQGRQLTYYTARLVPKLWSLTLRSQSRIFQDLTTPDILKKVLEGGGLAAGTDFDLQVQRNYPPRKYCVQYRESDYDFIARLMEEEGIYYFFAHGDDAEILTIVDKKTAHQPILGDSTVVYRGAETGQSGLEEVRTFQFRRQMRSGAVVLREFDFKKPKLNLEITKAADEESELEVYDYPGEYPDTSLGKAYAEIRLEEERAKREVGDGDGSCRRFVPGTVFTLSEHPRATFNMDYMITEVFHSGEQPSAATEDGDESQESPDEKPPAYVNEFRCIPAEIQFRPRRNTPRPVIEGVQTATVTGPPGEEIHVDEHGRIKVKFHWDRLGSTDDKSSCWIRVSQIWGGAGWGGINIPRVGQEVVVEFIEGDPDRPLVLGRLYNGEAPPPYGLPDRKTVSTIMSSSSPGGGGANEVRFEDAGGSEEFFLQASKDYNIVVKNNKTQLVEVDESLHVKNNRTTKIDVNQSETIGADKSIEVGGNHAEAIKGNLDLKVDGARTDKTKGGWKSEVDGSGELHVKGAHEETYDATHKQKIGATSDIEVGGALTEKAMSREITVSGIWKEKIGGMKKVQVGGILNMQAGGMLSMKGAMWSASGFKVKLAGTKVTIEGTAQLELKAGASSITIGPAGIDIKSPAMVTINGALVKIN